MQYQPATVETWHLKLVALVVKTQSEMSALVVKTQVRCHWEVKSRHTEIVVEPINWVSFSEVGMK